MQLLQAVCPKTLIDGFDCEILRVEENLLVGQDYETLVIDHHLKVVTSNDGTNPAYPHPLSITLLISQKVESCDLGIKTELSNTLLMIMLIEHHETLEGIRIVEMEHKGKKVAVFALWTRNHLTGKDSAFGWEIATAQDYEIPRQQKHEINRKNTH